MINTDCTNLLQQFYRLQYKNRLILVKIIFGLSFLSLLLISCSTTKNVISWNVELKESGTPITDKCDPSQKLTSVKSAEQPLLIPETEDREGRVRVLGIPCKEGEESPIYEIPLNRVKRITYVSDPLSPPVEKAPENLAALEGCCRVRDGVLFFDKLEIKGFVGYRGTEDSVLYPGTNGPEVYKSSFINFDRGGSSLVFGLDIIGSWFIHFIDESGKFQLGILTGLWPTDGSLFIPVGLNARYSFNQFPVKYSDNCNSWYLYGNIGLPLDFNTNAPIFGDDFDLQRYFYGLGVGHDWAISCDLDFSLDLGYRAMNLPLPEITCCPDVPEGSRNPFRKSDVLLLRFGLTF